MQTISTYRNQLGVLIGLTFIFLLNDFSNIFIENYAVWLLIDYVFVKIIPLFVIFYLIKNGMMSFSDFGIKKIKISQFLFLTILLSLAGVLIDQIGWRFFEQILPKTQVGHYPKIDNPIVNIIDLSIGLIFVGIIEETIFRGFYFTILKKYIKNTEMVILISAFVFGSIHWSLGLHAIINCSIWAILPLIVMWKTGSVIPAIIAHFLTNLVGFSGVIPNSWFKFIIQ